MLHNAFTTLSVIGTTDLWTNTFLHIRATHTILLNYINKKFNVLNIYPIATIPTTTIKINQNSNLGLTAFDSIIIDGKDSAVTLIINASIVPTPTPFAKSASATGIVPNILLLLTH